MMMMMMMEQERAGSGDERGGETSRCQDCGNKAKKNCVYIRCRTCCKRKGFECETHIKSTWIPAYKRRQKHHSHHHQYHSNNHYNSIHHHHHHHHQEQQLLPIEEQEQNQRQQQLLLFQLQGGGGGGGGGNSGSSHNPKRLRDLNPHSSSGLEAGNFPGQTSSQATFRCVKVSSVDGAMESQYAYQTAVTIGGHLFKGILYDQGPVENCNYANVGESSSDDPPPPSSNMAAIGMTPSTTACGGNSADQTLLPPPYSFPFSPFMFGTQFFPTPNLNQDRL